MKPRVYIETSVVSYLTAHLSRDLIVAGHQQVTHDWWHTRRESFELVASQLVIQEVSAGDSEAAKKRLKILQTIDLLETTDEALKLASNLSKEDHFQRGCRRRPPHCHCCNERCGLPADLELYAYRKCGHAK